MTNKKISRWFVLAAMAIAFFTVCYNTTALINALPVIATEFHINVANLQWLINGYVLVAVSLIAFSGKLGDIFSKKKVFVFGALGYLVASIVIALSWNQISLIGARTLQGLFAAFITSSSLTILKTTFNDKEVTLAIGIWTALIGVGNAIGPFIGGFITTYFGWRYIFWGNLIGIGFAIITALLTVEDFPKAEQKISIDYVGAVLLIVGLFLLVFALVQGNIWGWVSIKTGAFFVLGILALWIFKKVEQNKDYALVDFKYFCNKLFIFSSFGIFIAVGCSIGIPYFLNLYLQNFFVLNCSPVVAGATLLPFSFSILCASLLLSKFNEKFEVYHITLVALIILVLGLLGLAISSMIINYKLILLFLIIAGFGIGLIMPIFPKIALSAFAQKDVGQGSGLVNTVVYFADLLIIVIGNIIFYFFGGKFVLTAINKIMHINFNRHFFVNTALLGNKTSLAQLAKFPQIKNIFAQVAQHAAIIAFSSVIAFVLVAVIIYALLYFYLFPGRNCRSMRK